MIDIKQFMIFVLLAEWLNLIVRLFDIACSRIFILTRVNLRNSLPPHV